jgi:hypothetical protein
MNFVTFEISKKVKEKGFPLVYYIPTISQVLKWLRDEKKLHIVIPASFDEGYWWEVRDFNREISEYSDIEYTSYEQAALAGIEYVLDNLI